MKVMVNILKIYIIFTMIYRLKTEKKVEKLVANLHDKTEYVIHLRNLKHASNACIMD